MDFTAGRCGFCHPVVLIKSGFSRHITMNERRNASRISKGERGIWQHRYWEHLTRNENDFERHVDYIHYNPVKHGYIHRASEWLYSSVRRYIKAGIIINDWEVALIATIKAIMVSGEKLGFASSPNLQAIIRTATLHNTKIILQKAKVHIS
ncbi:hypothetical protein SAMN06296273_1639 [Nitrosomonas ureae]|uniref:Transposase n=1 Tax=Nitrosomonas ureae TaxID=44577 RepID=A0A285BZ50_9PROT|nr:hypothetical protein [Nitrosomonas ureae]SNX60176.1 hypothetical protein SAMN06296273_1639 [Nitrosomonas ureae]